MNKTLRVFVSSTNPIKLKATEEGLLAIKDYVDVRLIVESVKVDSGVSDQPKTSRETLQGALNRAKNAKVAQPTATYGLGLRVELGTADDIVFKRQNSKQGDGSVGILTHGAVDRAAYYKLAITLATIPLINKDLFESESIDELIKRIEEK